MDSIDTDFIRFEHSRHNKCARFESDTCPRPLAWAFQGEACQRDRNRESGKSQRMFAHGTRATQHRNNLASQAAAPHVPGNVGKQAILTELETRIGAFFSVITKLGNCCGCLFVMLAIVGTASAGSGPFRTTPNPDKVAHTRLQSGLIVVESALVVVLLASAGLFIRSYINVESVDTGFSSSTLTMNISLDARYSKVPQRIAFFQNLFAKLHVLPGVQAVG